MSMHPDINFFAEYKGNCTTYIETGTFRSESMELARKAGFNTIHSIDIMKHPDPLFAYDGVGTWQYHIGDSPEVLKHLLPKITDKYMVFLDAHSQMLEGEEDNYPLTRELQVILEQKHLPDVIMIDDYLYMTHPDITGFRSELIEGDLSVAGYFLQWLPNPIKNNILLATKSRPL